MKYLVLCLLIPLLPVAMRAQVPDFTVTDTEGGVHNLYSYLDSNHFVVLDFFFTNCSFCQYYAPQMDQSFEDFGCNTGNTFFLGIDYGDSDSAVQAFRQTYGMGYPAASGIEGGADSVISLYGVTGYPTVMLISPQKQLLKVITSPATATVDTILQLAGCVMIPCEAGAGSSAQGRSQQSCYPNPVSPGMLITIQPWAGRAVIPVATISDLAGNLVTRLQPVGEGPVYRVPGFLAPGLYILMIDAGDEHRTSGILVTK